MNQGGNSALQDNESRLKELKERAEKLKMNKETVSNEIDKMKNDISKQQVSLVYWLYFLLRNAQDNRRRPITEEELFNTPLPLHFLRSAKLSCQYE